MPNIIDINEKRGKRIRQETEDIKMLFKKFFSPFRNYVKTDEEKEKAFGISKVLWIFLALELDTEEHVYNSLYELFHNQDFALMFSSLYFFHMKTSLTLEEMSAVKTYYEDEEHIKEVENWPPSFFL